jgi:hypothetical protein
VTEHKSQGHYFYGVCLKILGRKTPGLCVVLLQRPRTYIQGPGITTVCASLVQGNGMKIAPNES